MSINNYSTLTNSCQVSLKEYSQWVLWRTENRNGKLAKIPYQINGRKAKTNDPTTWNTYENTLQAFDNNFAGLGFVFSKNDDFVFIDLDNCFDGNGSLNGHTKLVENFYDLAFIERSVSGKGLHIITKGQISKAFVDKEQNIEVYSTGRFAALTFDLYHPNTEIKDGQEVLNWMGVVGETKEEPTKINSTPEIPLPLVKHNLPYHFWENIKWLGSAYKGKSLGSYKSRSEVEAACVMILIKYGYNFEDAQRIFEHYKPGHYTEQGNNKFDYLGNCWKKSINKFLDSEVKNKLTEMYYNPPVFKLATDLNIYKGFLVCAFQADSFEVSVSYRTLMLLSNVKSLRTIKVAIGRLNKYIKKIPKNENYYANRYLVKECSISKQYRHHHHILYCLPTEQLSINASVFKFIGGSSQQIYLTLNETPQTPKNIANQISKAPSTVRKWLKKLEYYSLAFKIKGGWIVGDATIEDIAKVRGIYDEVAEHEQKIENERKLDREKYRKWKALLNESKNGIILEKD